MSQSGTTISVQEVDRIASLARLSPTAGEKEQLSVEMSNILGFVAQLNELETADIEPLHHVLDLHSVLRDDEIRESLPVTEALKNAPLRKGDYFVVPKVIKGVEG